MTEHCFLWSDVTVAYSVLWNWYRFQITVSLQ